MEKIFRLGELPLEEFLHFEHEVHDSSLCSVPSLRSGCQPATDSGNSLRVFKNAFLFKAVIFCHLSPTTLISRCEKM